MSEFKEGEVWLTKFPYDDDSTKFSIRPVIVLAQDVLGILSVKVTKHKPRSNDPYDLELFQWSEAGLRLSSTARISKTIFLDEKIFISKIGNLASEDLNRVEGMYIQFITDTEKEID